MRTIHNLIFLFTTLTAANLNLMLGYRLAKLITRDVIWMFAYMYAHCKMSPLQDHIL